MGKSVSSLGTFFKELRRRKVFQVAVVYAVVGWLLIQITQTCFPALHLPAWTVTFIVVLVIIGFPIAIIVAWAFELTPEGVKRTEDAEEELQEGKRKTGLRLEYAIIGLLVIAVVYLFYRIEGKRPEAEIPPVTAITSIAVLPFADMSPEKDQEYFCDGLADELLNMLAKVKGLRVTARTSSFSFKGKGDDIATIGEKLNVESVLEGSVRKADNQVRITTQLIKVSDGYHLWSETYDRRLDDIFAVQEEISRQVVDALKVTLLREDEKELASRPTGNIEAYQAYLKGRYYWNKRTEEGLYKAIECFEQAIEADPEYALAYAGIADSYTVLAGWSYMAPKDAYPKAKAAAKKALEIDNTLGEAHTSLASINHSYDWDWPAAESGFKRAIALNPNYATAHQWYAEYLITFKKFDEALAEIKLAQELDPLSLIIHHIFAYVYLVSGRYEEAMNQCKKAIELDPNFGQIHIIIGYINAAKGDYKKAVQAYQKAIELIEGLSFVNANLGYAYAMLGERDKAEQILNELKEKKKHRYVSSVIIAQLYAGLGENDKAFEWLDKAFEERDDNLVWITHFFQYDNLRDDPRFTALLKKMNLDNLQ